MDSALIVLPKQRMKRVTDPRLTVVSIGLAVMLLVATLFGVFARTAAARQEILTNLPWVILINVAVMAVLYLSDSRYQVAFDADGVYMRMPGFRWEILFRSRDVERDYGRRPGLIGWFGAVPVGFMAYDAIDEIRTGPTDRRFGGSGRYSPDAAIYLVGKMTPANLYGNMIGIDLNSFKRESIASFMGTLSKKRADLAPESWAAAGLQ